MRVLLAVLTLALLPLAAAAQAPGVAHPVVLVLAYGASWGDLLAPEHATLRGMAAQGAVGLLCCRTAGKTADQESATLTLGAGTRVTCDEAGEAAGLALCGDEAFSGRVAAEAYTALMGSGMGESQVAYLARPLVVGENSGLGYSVRPGLLGQTIREAGLEVAVVGNADQPALPPHRYAAAVAMDERGLVPRGDVGQRCLLGDEGPSGVRTNYDYLWQQVTELAGKCVLVVVESGDLDRLSRLQDRLTPLAYYRARRAALGKLDAFLARLVPEAVRGQWRVLLVSAGSKTPEGATELQPVLLWGAEVTPGFLGSASTRSPWLATTVDIAPTVLNLLHLAVPLEMVGRPARVTPATDQASAIRRLEAQQAASQAARGVVLKPVVVLMMVLLALAAGALLVPAPLGRWGAAAGYGLLGAACLPVALLLWPTSSGLSPGVLLAGVLYTAVALAALAAALHERVPVWLSLPAVTVLVLLADTLSGNRLAAGSALGYAPAEGARFYGLGNELGGLLLGATVGLLGAASALTKRRLVPLAVLALLGLALLVGLGSVGANFGVAMSAAVAAAAFAYYSAGRRRGLVTAGMACLVLGVGAVLLAADLHRESSHIGRLAALVGAGATGELTATAGRKLAMNWKLVRFSDWFYVLVGALAVAGGPALLRPAAWAGFAQARPGLARATRVLLVTAAAAFLLNDSGLLAAALALVAGSAGLGFEQLRQRYQAEQAGE